MPAGDPRRTAGPPSWPGSGEGTAPRCLQDKSHVLDEDVESAAHLPGRVIEHARAAVLEHERGRDTVAKHLPRGASVEPSDSANASASAATPMCTPHRSWLTSFTFWPSPGSGPTTGLVRDSASSRGRAVASAASEPDTIMSRSPVAARATSPDTGASTTSTPDSPSLRRRRRVPCLTLRGTRRARGGEQKPDPAHRRRSDTRRGGSIEQARGGQAVSCARGRHRLPAQPARCPAACQHHANRRHQARRGRAMASSGCLRRRRRQRPVARLGLGRATAAPASEVDTTAMHQVFAIGECMVELVHR